MAEEKTIKRRRKHMTLDQRNNKFARELQRGMMKSVKKQEQDAKKHFETTSHPGVGAGETK